MGFFIGLLMFGGTYLILGPTIMMFYVSFNTSDKAKANASLWFGIGLGVLYVALFIIVAVLLTKYIVWCVIGAIIGLICAFVTFNKNKEQTLININKEKSSFNNKLKGTDFMFDEILNEINHNGINYISEDNPYPYICQIIRYFDKNHVELAIKTYNPDLNIKFKFDKGLEVTPLDFTAMTNDVQMFKLLLNKGAESANVYQLAMFAIHNESYEILKTLLESQKLDINASLPDKVSFIEKEVVEDDCTLLDMAYEHKAHEKIITLLKSYGAKTFIDLECNPSYIEDLKYRISKIFLGKPASFSKSEIANSAINLQSFQQKLPGLIYSLAETKLREYDKQKEVQNYTSKEFFLEADKIRKEFSEIIGVNINSDGTI